MQLRILNSRSATVSQYLSSCGLGGVQKYCVAMPSTAVAPLRSGRALMRNGRRTCRFSSRTSKFENRLSALRIFWNVSGAFATIGGIFSGRGPRMLAARM